MANDRPGEKTENLLKKICIKHSYWWIKLQVDKDKMIMGLNQGTAMPADFLVATHRGAYLIECKEVEKGYRFPFVRFKQESKMNEAVDSNGFVQCYLFLNFLELDRMFLIPIKDYIELHKKLWQNEDASLCVEDILRHEIDDILI